MEGVQEEVVGAVEGVLEEQQPLPVMTQEEHLGQSPPQLIHRLNLLPHFPPHHSFPLSLPPPLHLTGQTAHSVSAGEQWTQ